MRTKGNKETTCRVCHDPFRMPTPPWKQRAKFWFSLKAKDRLNAYSRVWWQSLLQLYFVHSQAAATGAAIPRAVNGIMVRSASASELALLVASTEVRIWAGRESRRGKALFRLIKTIAWGFTAVSLVQRLK